MTLGLPYPLSAGAGSRPASIKLFDRAVRGPGDQGTRLLPEAVGKNSPLQKLPGVAAESPVQTPSLGIALTVAYFRRFAPQPAPARGKLSAQPLDGRGFFVLSIPIEVLEVEVLRLPRAERARLLDRVVASLDTDNARDEAWDRLHAMRDAELESGASSPVSGPEAI